MTAAKAGRAGIYKTIASNLVDEAKDKIQNVLHEASTMKMPTEDEIIQMQLKLRLDYSALTDHKARADFEEKLRQDLSNASGLIADCFVVKSLSHGSVIVDMEIKPDPSGKGPMPQTVAEELHRQTSEPMSRLFLGEVTCTTEAITFPALAERLSIMANGARALMPVAQEEIPHQRENQHVPNNMIDTQDPYFPKDTRPSVPSWKKLQLSDLVTPRRRALVHEPVTLHASVVSLALPPGTLTVMPPAESRRKDHVSGVIDAYHTSPTCLHDRVLTSTGAGGVLRAAARGGSAGRESFSPDLRGEARGSFGKQEAFRTYSPAAIVSRTHAPTAFLTVTTPTSRPTVRSSTPRLRSDLVAVPRRQRKSVDDEAVEYLTYIC